MPYLRNVWKKGMLEVSVLGVAVPFVSDGWRTAFRFPPSPNIIVLISALTQEQFVDAYTAYLVARAPAGTT